MTKEAINAFIISNNSKLPTQQIPFIRQRLESLDEEKSNTILSIELKSPIIAFLISWFLGAFAIDRFYIGDTKLGIFKLVSWITVIGGILWTIIDLFLIMGKTKQNNFDRLQQYLY